MGFWKLAERVLWAGSPVDRVRLAAARRDVDYLRDALNDSRVEVRTAAIQGLGQTGDPRAVGALFKVASAEPGLRSFALKALGALGDPRATDMLAEMGLSDDDPGARQDALAALAEMGSEPGHTVNLEARRHQAAAALRGRGMSADAAKSLALIMCESAAPAARAAVSMDAEPPLHPAAALLEAVWDANVASGVRAILESSLRSRLKLYEIRDPSTETLELARRSLDFLKTFVGRMPPKAEPMLIALFEDLAGETQWGPGLGGDHAFSASDVLQREAAELVDGITRVRSGRGYGTHGAEALDRFRAQFGENAQRGG